MGRLKNTGAALLAASTSFALAGSAFAQRAPEARRLVIAGEVTVTEDSNVARSDAAVAALRGINPQDTIVRPGVGLDIYLPSASSAVFLKGDLGYDVYRNNHILNAERLDIDGGVKTALGRCRVTLTGAYARQQSDLQDLTVVTTRNIADDESVKVDGDCGQRIGLAPVASIEESWSDNSAAVLQQDNHRDFTAKAGLAYRRPTFGELSLLGSYDRVDFPNRPLGATHDGYDAYAIGVKYDRRLGGRIEASARVGYVDLRPDDPLAHGFQGVTYGFEVKARPGGRATIGLKFDRDVLPSGRPDTTYVTTNTYAASLDYAIGPRIKLSMGAQQATNDYVGPALIPGFDLANDRIRSLHAGMRFEMGRKRSLSFDAWRDVRRANLSEFSYGDTRASVTLSLAI